jgi:hypothetical protein
MITQSLLDRYTAMATNQNPNSPYYDGPDTSDWCEHNKAPDQWCDICDGGDEDA